MTEKVQEHLQMAHQGRPLGIPLVEMNIMIIHHQRSFCRDKNLFKEYDWGAISKLITKYHLSNYEDNHITPSTLFKFYLLHFQQHSVIM